MNRLGLAWLLAAAAAFAQGDRPGQFDYYVMALSWSPQHCASSGGRDQLQCGSGKRFGFVLHGLWPQNDPRGWPEECATGARLNPETIQSMLDIMPSEGLIRHEWKKHGTCSGMDVRGYFTKAREAFKSVQVPGEFRGPSAQIETTPAEFKRKFLAANQRLRPDHVAVLCNGRFLQEVRVCLDKELKPRACASSVRDRCNVPEMIVRPVR